MTRSATSLLAIRDLSVTVDGKQILNGLTLEVEAGKVHAIMGPNGSGKSTLAHVLAGRPGYEVTAGTVTSDGQDLLAPGPGPVRACSSPSSIRSRSPAWAICTSCAARPTRSGASGASRNSTPWTFS